MPGELQHCGPGPCFREWFRRFVRKHMGRPLPPEALKELAPLNKLLGRDETFIQISRHRERDGDRFELRVVRRWRSPDFLLLPIAEALANLCMRRISSG